MVAAKTIRGRIEQPELVFEAAFVHYYHTRPCKPEEMRKFEVFAPSLLFALLSPSMISLLFALVRFVQAPPTSTRVRGMCLDK